MSFTLLIIAISTVIFILSLFSAYLQLLRKNKQIEEIKSLLDALFIKRNDLIPEILNTTMRYLDNDHIIEQVSWLSSTNKIALEYSREGELTKAVKAMIYEAHKSQELMNNEQFINLHYIWNKTEEQIAKGRNSLSEKITDYNNALSNFPGNLIGSIFKLKRHEWKYSRPAFNNRINFYPN